jgi:DNA primase
VLGHMGLEEFSAGAVREAVTHLLAQYEAGALDPEAFTRGDFGEAVQRMAAGALVDRHTASTGNWQRKYGIRVPGLNDEPFEAAAGAMTNLKLDRIAEAVRACQRRVYAAEQEGSDPTPHLRQMQQLHDLRASVERREFLTAA